jgi:uncharacterized protein YjbI with pentapeptide repeats
LYQQSGSRRFDDLGLGCLLDLGASRGRDLLSEPGANLREADLQGADFSKADLREADLGGANLLGADLSRADLEECGTALEV